MVTPVHSPMAKGDYGARGAAELDGAIDEGDFEELVVDAHVGAASEEREDGEVRERVVGAATSGADDVDVPAAVGHGPGDRLLEVGCIEVALAVEPLRGEGVAHVGEAVQGIEVADDGIGEQSVGERVFRPAVGGDDEHALAVSEQRRDEFRRRGITVGKDECAHGGS